MQHLKGNGLEREMSTRNSVLFFYLCISHKDLCVTDRKLFSLNTTTLGMSAKAHTFISYGTTQNDHSL